VLLSAVSVLVIAQSSSEVPEGLLNNPVFGEDRGMEQAVVTLIAEAQVQSQVSPSGIFGLRSGTAIGLLRVLRLSPAVSFHQCSVVIRHRRYNDICN